MNIRHAKTLFLLLIGVLLCLNALMLWRLKSPCGRLEAERRRWNATTAQPLTRSVSCPGRVVYTQPAFGRGRFGNRLLEYASAWAVAVAVQQEEDHRQGNVSAAVAVAPTEEHPHNAAAAAATLVLSDDVAWAMRQAFAGVSEPTKGEFVARLRRENAACACWMEWGLQEAPVAREAADMRKLLLKQRENHTPVSTRPHIILEEFIVPLRQQLRQQLKPLPALAAYVNKTMQNISQSLNKDVQEITFVGVHVRLTDYPRYITDGFGKNAQPVDVIYYLHATEYMIEQLEKIDTSNIVFLVVSDDEIWCKSNLIPALEQLLFSKKWSRGTLAVRWSGSSSYRQDFALLSSCNHSIIAYGTFAGGAALLAGGMTVVYDINRGKGGLVGGAMRFQALIPEWTLLY